MSVISQNVTTTGNCYRKRQHTQSALEDFHQAIDVDPQNKFAYYNRGVLEYRKGQYDLALADYLQILKIDEQFWGAYWGRGKILFEEGKLQAALDDFERSKELAPKEVYPPAGIAVARYALGDVQGAKQLWRTLIESDTRLRDEAWLAEEYDWNTPLIQEAHKLIEELQAR